jgi:hypothetical protein
MMPPSSSPFPSSASALGPPLTAPAAPAGLRLPRRRLILCIHPRPCLPCRGHRRPILRNHPRRCLPCRRRRRPILRIHPRLCLLPQPLKRLQEGQLLGFLLARRPRCGVRDGLAALGARRLAAQPVGDAVCMPCGAGRAVQVSLRVGRSEPGGCEPELWKPWRQHRWHPGHPGWGVLEKY